jgi:hypothetical protein
MSVPESRVSLNLLFRVSCFVFRVPRSVFVVRCWLFVVPLGGINSRRTGLVQLRDFSATASSET